MHAPVMVEEVISVLITDMNGVYLDLNLGDGGHACAITESLGDGSYRYIGVDRDPRSIATARTRLADRGSRMEYRQGDHGAFPDLLDPSDRGELTGILFDLGFSSTQLDAAPRGFSFDADGPLDMRYGETGETAADLLMRLSEDELREAFITYGNLSGSARLARAIVRQRRENPLVSTGELCALAEDALRPTPPRRRKVLSQLFQTLRVLVNDEVGSFRRALDATYDWLKPDGVLCVIAYESVTDRMAKRHFHPQVRERDVYGNPIEPLRWDRLTRRAMKPTDDEVRRNPRSRSARLRAAKKVEVPS